MSRFLVNSDDANRFLDLMSTDSGRNAYLGERLIAPSINQHQIRAHDEVKKAVGKVADLVKDKTRSEPEKHEAARQIARNLIKVLDDKKRYFKQHSDELYNEAHGAGDFLFNPDANRAGLDSEMRQWVRSQAEKGELSTIKAEMLKDQNLAAIIWHSPHYLLGINPNGHQTMKYECLQKFEPESYSKLALSVEISKLPEKYEKVINSVNSSFYNAGMADKAATRVDVNG